MKKHLHFIILILVFISALIIMGWAYFEMIQENQSFDWKKIILKHDNNIDNVYHDFTFDCPDGWELQDNLDYDGKVKVKQCVLDNNKPKDVSFEDGVIVSFKYLPNFIAINFETRYQNLISNIKKNNSIVKEYKNNNFQGLVGWDENGYEVFLLARSEINDGYYEVSSLIVFSNLEEKNSEFNNRMNKVDEIISSFKIKTFK